MRVGVIYPQTELRGDPEAVRRIGCAVENLGFHHFVAYDHVLGAVHDREPRLNGPYTEKHPFHDPLAMFAHLAGLTSRIEFVTGVMILPQRQTALVARQATDVDLFSAGRLQLGVGLGWNYVEYEALGQEFARRGRRLEEQVTLLRRLWTEPVVDFSGTFDRIDRAGLLPRPTRQIPLLFGGFADVALRRGARLGNGFIFADGAADAFEAAPKLLGFLEEEKRSRDGFFLHINMLRAKNPGEVVETVERWQALGGSHASVNTMGMSLQTIDGHLEYIERVSDALHRAGLLRASL